MKKKEDTPDPKLQKISPVSNDKTVPVPGRRSGPAFPIVGIGASAGGLALSLIHISEPTRPY